MQRPTLCFLKTAFVLIVITVSGCFLYTANNGSQRNKGRIYYVATDGRDKFNGLSPSYRGGNKGPFRTLSRAADTIKAGDTVRVRVGTYREASSWDTDGTEDQPITITNYEEEVVIIDGDAYSIPSDENGVLFQISGDWYKVSNLQVRCPSGNGLAVIDRADHCRLDNITARDNWASGIFISGWYGLVSNCRAYGNSLINKQFRPHEGATAFGISACRYPRYTSIRGCHAWDNWGEGISTFESYHTTIEDCVSYNNQQNFYISNCRNCLFQRNLSYYTPGNKIQAYDTQNGILLGDEKPEPSSSGHIIINNLVLGGERNIAVGSHVFNGTLIANNTFVNASATAGDESACVYFFAGNHKDARFFNNIIFQEDAVAICHQEATGIIFQNNLWSKPPDVSCRGIGDIVGNPRIAGGESFLPGALSSQWFSIQDGSPALGRAMGLREVVEDFFRVPRGNYPDIGACEYSKERGHR